MATTPVPIRLYSFLKKLNKVLTANKKLDQKGEIYKVYNIRVWNFMTPAGEMVQQSVPMTNSRFATECDD